MAMLVFLAPWSRSPLVAAVAQYADRARTRSRSNL